MIHFWKCFFYKLHTEIQTGKFFPTEEAWEMQVGKWTILYLFIAKDAIAKEGRQNGMFSLSMVHGPFKVMRKKCMMVIRYETAVVNCGCASLPIWTDSDRYFYLSMEPARLAGTYYHCLGAGVLNQAWPCASSLRVLWIHDFLGVLRSNFFREQVERASLHDQRGCIGKSGCNTETPACLHFECWRWQTARCLDIHARLRLYGHVTDSCGV